MKIQPVKNISEVLRHSSLAKVVEHSNQINQLNHKIKQKLPEAYRGLYRVINLYDSCLVIEVQNATIRQGLLLQQPILLRLIQQDFPEITQLECKLNPQFRAI